MKVRAWMKLKDEYKICKEVFGQEYKRHDEFDGRIDYTRRDYLEKLLEQKEVIDHMRIELFEANLALKSLRNIFKNMDINKCSVSPTYNPEVSKAISVLAEFNNKIDNIFWDESDINVIYQLIKIAYQNLIDELRLEGENRLENGKDKAAPFCADKLNKVKEFCMKINENNLLDKKDRQLAKNLNNKHLGGDL